MNEGLHLTSPDDEIKVVACHCMSIVPHLPRFDTTPLRGAFSRVLASGRSPERLRTMIVVALQRSNQHKRVEKGPTPVLHDQHVDARERTITSGLGLCWESGGPKTEGEMNELRPMENSIAL